MGDRDEGNRERTRETETTPQVERRVGERQRETERERPQIRIVDGLWLEELMLPEITRNNKGQDAWGLSRLAGRRVLHCIAKQQSAKQCGPGTRTDIEGQSRIESSIAFVMNVAFQTGGWWRIEC